MLVMLMIGLFLIAVGTFIGISGHDCPLCAALPAPHQCSPSASIRLSSGFS